MNETGMKKSQFVIRTVKIRVWFFYLI
jgi:hypothetical protein